MVEDDRLMDQDSRINGGYDPLLARAKQDGDEMFDDFEGGLGASQDDAMLMDTESFGEGESDPDIADIDQPSGEDDGFDMLDEGQEEDIPMSTVDEVQQDFEDRSAGLTDIAQEEKSSLNDEKSNDGELNDE